MVIELFIIIMDGDPLVECFMDRFAENVIEVRFPAEDQGEAVQGIIAVIHEHLDVIEDTIAEVLGFIDGKEQGLVLVAVQIGDLFLDGFEHGWFTAFIRDAQNGTELFIEVSDTDGGQAHILHVVLVGIQALGKTTQSIRVSHAGKCGENPNASYIFQMIETDIHFHKVFGTEAVLFFELLFVKRGEGKSIKRVINHGHPPIFE